mmetsp:Transcript_35853/g.107016  ORF Transcript_35853/g.107016 Transcript_35853/m.107016 type:complete len:399 (+) Transcript_35853:1539-2735(+)
MAETHPEVLQLRRRSQNATLPSHVRSAARADAYRIVGEVRRVIEANAPVVVASCVGAHQLLSAEGTDHSFPLVVLDEAAQTTEPALLTALAAAGAEQVAMVGDTKQLPPTVASSAADLRAELGRSPMARLEDAGVGRRTLCVQYRMPPSLLEHPSRYFYDGLVSCASADDDGGEPPPPRGFPWPKGHLPLAFVRVGDGGGEVAHDFGGRSNPSEAEAVCNIVAGLLEGGDVDPFKVAVISPYSKQVDRIRAGLQSLGVSAGSRGAASAAAGKVRVGTVDSFQGQETDVVIFSGVRSNPEGQVGFLRDPRRLCVAITRARRGLVLVGDDRSLRTSRHWAALIESCRRRGCCLDADDLLPRNDERGLTVAEEGDVRAKRAATMELLQLDGDVDNFDWLFE